MRFIYLLCLLFSTNVFGQDSIVVSIDRGTVAQNVHLSLFTDFEKQTNIKVIRYIINDMKQLDTGSHWKTQDGKAIDIIKGHASQRLQHYYNQGDLLDLSALWQKNNWDQGVKSLKPLVTYDNAILGFPYELNTWNIYYKKNVMARFGPPPETLDELASLCQKINKKGLIPFQIMTDEPYTIMAWFEYILLRTYGLDTYNALIQGDISYFDKRVTTVLTHWKSLIDAGCFKDDFSQMSWQKSLPYFYRDKIVMLFMGSHIMSNISDPKTRRVLNLMLFPRIADIPRFEAVPVDVYIVNKATKNIDAVEKFLNFINQPDVQSLIANHHFSLPAHQDAKIKNQQFTTKLAKFIKEAKGVTPFIDRAWPPSFEIASRPFFIKFIKDGDIDFFQYQLEQLRLQFSSASPALQDISNNEH